MIGCYWFRFVCEFRAIEKVLNLEYKCANEPTKAGELVLECLKKLNCLKAEFLVSLQQYLEILENPRPIVYSIKEARELESKNKIEGAKEIYLFLAETKKDKEAFISLAEMALKSGNIKVAFKWFEKASSIKNLEDIAKNSIEYFFGLQVENPSLPLTKAKTAKTLFESLTSF